MSNKLRICQACVTKERKLFSIRQLQESSITVDLVLADLNLNYEGSLCWECKGIIVKFSKFKKQVELAQISIKHKKKLQDLKCLSTLSCTGTNTLSYLEHNNPLNSDTVDQPKDIKKESDEEDAKDNSVCDYDEKPALDSDIYVEESEIKEKLAFNSNIYAQESEIKKKLALDSDNCIQESEIKEKLALDSDISVQESEIKEVTIKKKVKLARGKRKKNDNGIKDKFIEVEITEEEMVKSREEKRSHPNFKKLPYNCDSCVLGFTRKQNYDTHMEKKHNTAIGSHVCPVCKVRFSFPNSLAKHVKKHYNFYRCKLCTYETTELWSALNHCRSKHSEDTEDCIHCPQCSYIAKTPSELAEHKKTQHSLICKECGEKFVGRNTLKTHIRRIHSTAREHKCDTCQRAFLTRGRLEAHMTSHGAAAAQRLAYCQLCQVQYKNIYVYRSHLLTSANHSERRFHCDECGKKFASKVYFKRHYTFYHQKKSPFKCELCNRLFISEWRLRSHRQTHHGLPRARNHACDQCGKKFYTSATLKAHQLTHSAQRTFMCSFCGDTFKQRPALYTHTRAVHRARHH